MSGQVEHHAIRNRFTFFGTALVGTLERLRGGLTCPAIGDKRSNGEGRIVESPTDIHYSSSFRPCQGRSLASRREQSRLDNLPALDRVRIVARSVREREIALRAHLDQARRRALEFEQLQAFIGDVKLMR